MKLIPQPQQLELQEGTYRIGYQDRITLDAACSPAAYGYAKLLAGELEEQAGISLLIDRRTHTTHPGIRLLQAERPRLGRQASGSLAAERPDCCTVYKPCGKSSARRVSSCPAST